MMTQIVYSYIYFIKVVTTNSKEEYESQLCLDLSQRGLGAFIN